MISNPSIPALQKIGTAAILLLLTACAQFEKEPVAVPECYTPPKVVSEFDKLLAFAADFAGMPAPARAEVCGSLLKRQKEAPDTSVYLQLLSVRAMSDACGDIGKIVQQIDEMPAENLQDESLRRFVAAQKEGLKNMVAVTKKLGSLERKQKKYQSVLESKETAGTKANEARLLREKLDAIRTMEKQLDESGDGKP